MVMEAAPAAGEAPPQDAPKTPTAPAADPADAAPPEAAPTGEAGDAANSEDKGAWLRETLKDIKPEELDALLGELPEEVRKSSTVIAAERRSAEERGRVRAQEELQGREAQQSAYAEVIAIGEDARAWVGERMREAQPYLRALNKAVELGDTDLAATHLKAVEGLLNGQHFETAMHSVEQGALFKAADIKRQEMTQFIAGQADLIGKLTEEENDRLTAAAYQDRRTGTNRAQYGLLEIMLQRAEARGFEKGREKGLKDKEATAALYEKATKLQEARNGAAPAAGRVSAPSAGGRRALEQEMRAIDVTTPAGVEEWTRRQGEFQRRLRDS